MKAKNLVVVLMLSLSICKVQAQSSASERNYITMQIQDPTDSYSTISTRAKAYFKGLTHETETPEDEQLEEKFEAWDKYWEHHSYYPGCSNGGNIKGAMAYQASISNNVWCNTTTSAATTWSMAGHKSNAGNFCNMGFIETVAVAPSNNNIMFAGSNTGGLFKTTDGGNSWTNLTDYLGLFDFAISDVAVEPVNPNFVILGTGPNEWSPVAGYGIYESINGGATWTPAVPAANVSFNTTLTTVYGITYANGYIYAAMGKNIYRRLNNGQLGSPWSLMSIDQAVNFNPAVQYTACSSTVTASYTTNLRIKDIEALPNSSTLYASTSGAGGPNLILKSTDAGSNWNQIALPTNATYGNSFSGDFIGIDVTPADPGALFV